MSELERWYSLASEIEVLISKVEAEVAAQSFKDTASRHSLSKIDKKLYEALEIANKAADALSDD